MNALAAGVSTLAEEASAMVGWAVIAGIVVGVALGFAAWLRG